jgi:hypothetical protein
LKLVTTKLFPELFKLTGLCQLLELYAPVWQKPVTTITPMCFSAVFRWKCTCPISSVYNSVSPFKVKRTGVSLCLLCWDRILRESQPIKLSMLYVFYLIIIYWTIELSPKIECLLAVLYHLQCYEPLHG